MLHGLDRGETGPAWTRPVCPEAFLFLRRTPLIWFSWPCGPFFYLSSSLLPQWASLWAPWADLQVRRRPCRHFSVLEKPRVRLIPSLLHPLPSRRSRSRRAIKRPVFLNHRRSRIATHPTTRAPSRRYATWPAPTHRGHCVARSARGTGTLLRANLPRGLASFPPALYALWRACLLSGPPTSAPLFQRPRAAPYPGQQQHRPSTSVSPL